MILEDEPNTFYTNVPFQYLPYVHLLLVEDGLPYNMMGAFFNTDDKKQKPKKLVYITFHNPEDCFSFLMKRDTDKLHGDAVAWQKQKNPSL